MFRIVALARGDLRDFVSQGIAILSQGIWLRQGAWLVDRLVMGFCGGLLNGGMASRGRW